MLLPIAWYVSVISISRYWKYLSVLESVSADKKSAIIGHYRYRPIWKKGDLSPTNLVLIPSILSDIYITGHVGTPTYIWIEKVFLTCKRDLYCYHNWKDSNMFWDHDDVGSSFPNLILLLIGWPPQSSHSGSKWNGTDLWFWLVK